MGIISRVRDFKSCFHFKLSTLGPFVFYFVGLSINARSINSYLLIYTLKYNSDREKNRSWDINGINRI